MCVCMTTANDSSCHYYTTWKHWCRKAPAAFWTDKLTPQWSTEVDPAVSRTNPWRLQFEGQHHINTLRIPCFTVLSGLHTVLWFAHKGFMKHFFRLCKNERISWKLLHTLYFGCKQGFYGGSGTQKRQLKSLKQFEHRLTCFDWCNMSNLRGNEIISCWTDRLCRRGPHGLTNFCQEAWARAWQHV